MGKLGELLAVPGSRAMTISMLLNTHFSPEGRALYSVVFDWQAHMQHRDQIPSVLSSLYLLG